MFISYRQLLRVADKRQRPAAGRDICRRPRAIRPRRTLEPLFRRQRNAIFLHHLHHRAKRFHAPDPRKGNARNPHQYRRAKTLANRRRRIPPPPLRRPNGIRPTPRHPGAYLSRRELEVLARCDDEGYIRPVTESTMVNVANSREISFAYRHFLAECGSAILPSHTYFCSL